MSHRSLKRAIKAQPRFVILIEQPLTIFRTRLNHRQHFSFCQRDFILREAMLQANKRTRVALVHSLFHFKLALRFKIQLNVKQRFTFDGAPCMPATTIAQENFRK